MTQPILNLRFGGGFGNQLCMYAYGRAYAEANGYELRCYPWLGDKLFDLDHPKPTEVYYPYGEKNPPPPGQSCDFTCTGQSQATAIYTRSEARFWFRFRPEIARLLSNAHIPYGGIVAHRRIGDYATLGSGYPVITARSYTDCLQNHNLSDRSIQWISQEFPITIPNLGPELSFLPDFYRMLYAEILLRANSTFSYWAAVLGEQECVFSPVIDNHNGGLQDVPFVEGNHPRISFHDRITDIYLQP